jgi:hypothetical protein
MMHAGKHPEAPGTKVNNTVAQSGIKIGPGRVVSRCRRPRSQAQLIAASEAQPTAASSSRPCRSVQFLARSVRSATSRQ